MSHVSCLRKCMPINQDISAGATTKGHCKRKWHRHNLEIFCLLTIRINSHFPPSNKISQLVAAGITDTNVVKRSLRFYISNTLCRVQLPSKTKWPSAVPYHSWQTKPCVQHQKGTRIEKTWPRKRSLENWSMAVNKCWHIILFSNFCFARRGANSVQKNRDWGATTRPDMFPNTLSCSEMANTTAILWVEYSASEWSVMK